MAKTAQKRVVRSEWTNEDLSKLKAHSRSKTPVAKTSKLMKRHQQCLASKGTGIGHKPWSPEIVTNFAAKPPAKSERPVACQKAIE